MQLRTDEYKLLTTFKGFNRTKANEWIAALAKEDPRPDAFIAAIRRLARVQSKAELVSDAELILNTIHGISGVRGKTRSVALADLFQDVVCQMSPPPLDKRCDILKAELRVTVASLYNNAARQVASNEIDRLTTVTEGELHGLRKLNELMASRVRERVDIRLKLKSLNRASVDVFVPPGHGRSAH